MSETCADCGKPINYGEPSYYSKDPTCDIGKTYHSMCGDPFGAKAMATRVAILADAMGQILDDMGKTGQSVCLAAKIQARIAFEPFRTADNYSGDDVCMSLEEARAALSTSDRSDRG